MTINKIIRTGLYAAATVALFSCGSKGNNTGHSYMADMGDSRAYETYAPAQERLNNSEARGATFSGMPVEGTIARGEMAHYKLKNDTVGYRLSAGVKNPLDIASVNMKESERLYLVNCAICHGVKLDGDGPLYKGGQGPFKAAPKNFMGDDMKKDKMADGTMYHSVTYGKGQMGSYASQLSPQQRWMVIAYIRSKQGGGTVAGVDSVGAAKADTLGTAGK